MRSFYGTAGSSQDTIIPLIDILGSYSDLSVSPGKLEEACRDLTLTDYDSISDAYRKSMVVGAVVGVVVDASRITVSYPMVHFRQNRETDRHMRD